MTGFVVAVVHLSPPLTFDDVVVGVAVAALVVIVVVALVVAISPPEQQQQPLSPRSWGPLLVPPGD